MKRRRRFGLVKWVAVGCVACDGGGLQWPMIVVRPWWLGDGVPPWVLGLKGREQNKREKEERETEIMREREREKKNQPIICVCIYIYIIWLKK